jgi:hypothetical protein
VLVGIAMRTLRAILQNKESLCAGVWVIDRLSPTELECGNCMWGNQCAIDGLSCAHKLRRNEFELTARKGKNQ